MILLVMIIYVSLLECITEMHMEIMDEMKSLIFSTTWLFLKMLQRKKNCLLSSILSHDARNPICKHVLSTNQSLILAIESINLMKTLTLSRAQLSHRCIRRSTSLRPALTIDITLITLLDTILLAAIHAPLQQGEAIFVEDAVQHVEAHGFLDLKNGLHLLVALDQLEDPVRFIVGADAAVDRAAVEEVEVGLVSTDGDVAEGVGVSVDVFECHCVASLLVGVGGGGFTGDPWFRISQSFCSIYNGEL